MQAAIARLRIDIPRIDISRIDMAHLALAIDRPARDGVEVMAREAAHRGHLGRLPALGHELLAGRRRVPAFPPGPALQDRGPPAPAPPHPKGGEGGTPQP